MKSPRPFLAARQGECRVLKLMATITAPGAQANDTPARPVEPPSRPLWQAPIFVLGIAALVGVALGRPFPGDGGSSRRIVRDLAHARQILDRSDGDPEHALKLAQRALELADEFPDHIAEAAFLAGTAYIRLAEKAEPSRADDGWKRARQYLDQAKSAEGLPEADQPRLMYNLGKVGFYVGDDLNAVIHCLEDATPRVETRAEGYGLLTQAFLRLQPPNLQKALDCNIKLRSVGDASEAEVFAAKLLGGELLMRLGRFEEARKSLEKIREKEAPAEILVRARLLCARCYQEEKQWGDAARLYQTALSDHRVPLPNPAQVYYNLGLCYRNREQPEEAAKAWQKCWDLAKGVEGQAAALVLADLHLLNNLPERALEMLTKAVTKIRTPADWNNPLIDLPRALAVYKRAAEVFREADRHELAMQLLESYAKLASPLEVLSLRGDVAMEWAKVRMQRFNANRMLVEEEKRALELYVQAAEAYADAAGQAKLKPADKARFLWLSSTAYREARDSVKAADGLKQVVKVEVEPEKLGEAWYRLGEVYRLGGEVADADKAYHKCMEYVTRFACQARYQLAMAALAGGNVDEAMAFLMYNLKEMWAEDDSDALAESLIALGDLLYQRRDYRGVTRYLERALERFNENPKLKDNPEVTRARYELADSYRQISSQENLQRFVMRANRSAEEEAHFKQEHLLWLKKAADEFAALDAYLATPSGKDHLTKEQRTQVPFVTAKCWFNLGQYDKSLHVYERLIERYPEQLEGLDALGGAVSCHAALGQIDKIRQRLLQMRMMLPRVSKEVQKVWEDWINEASKMLEDLRESTH
jgi:tetratricopeptide (TPR) repeat protein